MNYSDKVVLVTGAGSGVGFAIAQAFAQVGATVLANDLRPESAPAVEAIGARYLQADLADPVAVRSLAEQALSQAGRVDILVNNAGFQHIDPIENFPEEIWSRLLQVMLTAPFQLIKYLIPGMKERRWGRIINISSVHGLVASPFKAGYISAKHGLMGLTKTVALEAGPYGVTINAICPAYIRTPLVEKQITDQARTRGIPENEVIEKVMLESVAIKRLIEPEEVAAYTLFLASDQAGAITGAAQIMDMGWMAR